MATVALFGSGEFLSWARPVDEALAASSSVAGERVLIVPTASAPEGAATFDRWGEMGVEHYRELGLSPEVVELRARADAFDPRIVDRVAGARIVFFSGGNPGYLTETLEGTPFWEAVVAAVAQGTALGGCSAGAVAVGTLAPFVTDQQIERWVPGLSLLARAFVAPHFDMLESYQPGLRRLVLRTRPDGNVMVGIDENTAMIGDGDQWTVHGRGGVWVGSDGVDADLTSYRAGQDAMLSLDLRLP